MVDTPPPVPETRVVVVGIRMSLSDWIGLVLRLVLAVVLAVLMVAGAVFGILSAVSNQF